jgi:D-alanyl-D-alanine carboxypeptidase (penicillin-binding protein 5/6)
MTAPRRNALLSSGRPIFSASVTALRLILALVLLVAAAPRSATASSWVIIDDQTGHILAGQAATQKRQIASLTKMAAAMVALDWVSTQGASLAEMATVPAAVTGVGGMNPCGLQPGDRVSLRDLLYASMMTSDNHAAFTLAHHVGTRLANPNRLPPVDNFTSYMNALARQLGMRRTVFLNPHGLDNMTPPPTSTAADVARLTRYAYAHAGFNFYVSQPTREISIEGADGQARGFLLRNTNQLLGQDGIVGVKTGRTARAGDCVVLASERPPQAIEQDGKKIAISRRLIVVLLGSSDRFSEGLGLVRRGWALHDRWSAEGRPISRRSSL